MTPTVKSHPMLTFVENSESVSVGTQSKGIKKRLLGQLDNNVMPMLTLKFEHESLVFVYKNKEKLWLEYTLNGFDNENDR